MNAATHHSSEVREGASAAFQFPPLESVTRSHVTTAEAAYYLSRKPHTLHIWASSQKGPVLPQRVNGRLAWSVTGIKAALGVA